MNGSHSATFYVQIEPEWSRFTDRGGNRSVYAISAVRLTKRRPSPPVPGSVTVKLTVRIPDAAFLPLRPEAVVEIPAELVQANLPVEVVAEDGHDGGD